MVFSTPSGARQTAERILMLSADSVLCRNYLDGQAAIEVVRELGKMGNPNALRLLGEIEAT